MKTTRNTLLLSLLLTLLIPSLVMAGGGKTKKANTASTQVTETAVTPLLDEVEVRIIKPDHTTIKVKIYTEEGTILFIDRIKKKNQVAITYDISDFPPGDYRFDLIKNREVIQSKTVKKDTSSEH